MYILRLPVIFSVLILLVGFTSSFAAFDSTTFNKSKTKLVITRITPAGKDVPAKRQIVFKFNQPVVPIGRMQRTAAEIPISIQPKVQCEWRWLNTSSLACQLSQKTRLKYATQYKITVKPGLKTIKGARMTKTLHHQFITKRPQANYAYHSKWRSPVLPVLRVDFNQPVHKDSVRKSLFFKFGTRKIQLSVTPFNKKNKSLYANYWLVQPVKALPSGSTVKLMVRPGLVSRLGPLRGVQKRVVTTLHTFPAFKFKALSCYNKAAKRIEFNDVNFVQFRKCSPDHHVELRFTAPFSIKSIADNISLTPDSRQWKELRQHWLKGRYSYNFSPRHSHSRNQVYSLYITRAIKADTLHRVIANHHKIKDIFGRTLGNRIHLKFRMGNYKPRAILPQRVSVLEQGVDPLLFVRTINVKNILLNYSRITVADFSDSQTQNLTPKTNKNNYVTTRMNLSNMLGTESGAIAGHFKTTPLTHLYRRNFHYFTQVTPWHAHMKFGHFNSLLWVTNLKTGQVVKDARIEIIKGNILHPKKTDPVLAEGTSDESGLATLPGMNKLDPQISSYSSYYYTRMMYAKVIKGKSIALLPFTYDFRNRYYQIANNGGSENIRRPLEYIKSWGFTAQGVHKPGDTIDFKLFVRDENNLGFITAPKVQYTLRIFDPQNREVYKNDKLKLSAFGSFSDRLKTFKSSKSGWYQFRLKVKGSRFQLNPMRVLVTDFTPAPFRVSSTLDRKLYQAGDTLKLNTQSKLHAGGPFANGETRITTMLVHQPLSPSTPKARGFSFNNPRFYRKTLNQVIAKSNENGIYDLTYSIKKTGVVYGRLVTESAVKEERGKYVTTQSTATYAGRDRYTGLRLASWVLKQDKPANIYTLVINQQGKLATDIAHELRVQYQQTSISRKKNKDGILETRYKTKWIPVKTFHLVSGNDKKITPFTPPKAGYYKFTSTVTDTKGRKHQSTVHGWASGKGRVYWKPKPGFKLDVTAQSDNYKIGDKARFLIRNPYPGAKALITIERKGILKKWVTTLKNNIEILDIPVTPDYLPGFYVSVLVMAPRRASKDKKHSLAPGFRIGYARINVKDPYNELVVKVNPKKKVYKPRDTVKVDINVKTRQGKTPATELAVVVLDESVFDLLSQGKAYFDPYTGMYKLDGLGVANFNLLQKLIAHKKKLKNKDKEGSPLPTVARRQKKYKVLGRLSLRKASAPMQESAAADMAMKPKSKPGSTAPEITVRNIFKYLSYWNGTIHTDTKGNASVKFKAPDNLTGWRVLVIAVDKAKLMGLGQGKFKVNLPLELRPALPNQVTEGDLFTARFSIMNRTNKARKVELVLTASGNIKGKSKTKRVSIMAKPYKRIMTGIEVQATSYGKMSFTAKAVSGKLGDATRLNLNINRMKSMEVSANYGTSTSNSVSETIKLPGKIRMDIGKLAVTISSSIIGHLKSAFDYLQQYPYACWEQKLTKGVMASHYQKLRPWLPKKFSWKGSKKLPELTLSLAASHQAPNGGMAYYVPQNRRVSPYLSAYTAIAFNWLRSHGHKIPAKVEKRLHTYLLGLIRNKRFPSYYNRGMSSTLRAIALAALAEHGKVSRKDILRYMPHVQYMSLFGKAHFLKALVHTDNTSAEQRKVMNIIQSKANETGGKYVFSERVGSNYRHLLYSASRSQCAILSSMLAYETKEKNRATDVPFKLVRTITAMRKRTGRWNNTQDNMFCTSALIDYAKVYEKQPPDMVLTLMKDQKNLGSAKLKGYRAQPQVISRPIGKLGKLNKNRQFTIQLNRKGKGRYYYNTRLHYSLKKLRKNAVNSGIVINREYSVERNKKWVLLKSPMKIERGELVRVDIYVDLPAARNFVVVDDPVPGGLEPVNTNLATASKVDARKAKMLYAKDSYWHRHRGWRGYGYSFWSFYHREILHNSVRFYSEYLPAGKYHLSYVAQAIAPGKFTVMPSHTEEMYNPDTYGKSKPAILEVSEPVIKSVKTK